MERSAYRKRAKRYHDAIRTVLLRDWDPIGVSDVPEAHDEYDSYIPGIHGRLISRASAQELFDHLRKIETIEMGLASNRQRTQHVVQKLIALINEIESEP